MAVQNFIEILLHLFCYHHSPCWHGRIMLASGTISMFGEGEAIDALSDAAYILHSTSE